MNQMNQMHIRFVFYMFKYGIIDRVEVENQLSKYDQCKVDKIARKILEEESCP